MAHLDTYVSVRMDHAIGSAFDIDFTTGTLVIDANDHRQYDQGGGIVTDIYGDFTNHVITSIVQIGTPFVPFTVSLTDLNLAYTNESQFATLFSVLDYAPGDPDTLNGSDEIDVLYGRGGDDLLVGNAGGFIALGDVLDGGQGNDTILGGIDTDTLIGGAGNDYIDGGLSPDTITGGPGNDTMIGGDGDGDLFTDVRAGDVVIAGGGVDTLMAFVSRVLKPDEENLTLLGTANLNGTGNGHFNIMLGNAGNNILSGGLGNDTLDGGGGDDTLTGGQGKDLLTPWGGLDRIKYSALTESGVTFATRDVINTFAHGDKIDLSALDANAGAGGNQAFTFVAAFTHVAGQLQWHQTAPTGFLIQGDVNGDAVADFSLQIYAAPGFGTIHSSDFIL